MITDCVTCQFPKSINPFTSQDNLNIDGYEFAPGVPKYKMEDKEDRLNVERMKACQNGNVHAWEESISKHSRLWW